MALYDVLQSCKIHGERHLPGGSVDAEPETAQPLVDSGSLVAVAEQSGPTAVELIAQIKNADLEQVQQIRDSGETRTTVIAALDKRETELQAAE